MPVFHGVLDDNDELMISLEGEVVPLEGFLERLGFGKEKKRVEPDDATRPTAGRLAARAVTSSSLTLL